VGGDWYDAFGQPDGAALLVIGDVVGHNVDAAAAMGQIRSILRGIAYDRSDNPAQILRRVDEILIGLQIDTMATALVARLEQPSGPSGTGPRMLCWSSAGHLPPLLLRADGTVRSLQTAPERLLGAGWTRTRSNSEVRLNLGDTVVCYTDGLVEHGRTGIVDHIAVLRAALAQLPGGHTRGKKVLVRVDGAGGTHELLAWLTRRRLSYSVGFSLPGDLSSIQAKLATIPADLWEPAYDAGGQLRPGAWVAEVTELFNLSSWPTGMRVIVRKERPHPGAQLRITDLDGHRITAFVTNTTRGQLADLELRHRRRARCEDRIRAAKDTGLANLPLHDFTQNQIWCAIVALACEVTAWMQTLTVTGHDGYEQARRWEPKRLRLRLFSIPARAARTGRRRLLHLAATAPFTALALTALAALTRLTATPRVASG
jgi:hypothetical protein